MKKILLLMVASLLVFGIVSCDQDVKTKTYKVMYNANGAVGVVPASIEVEEGGTITVSSQGSLSMKGYDFVGWNTKKDGSGKTYEESQFLKVDSDISLYAQWSIHEYSISYDLGGGSYPEGRSNPKTYTIETENFTLNNPEKDGYEFLGWKTSENDEPSKNVSIDQGNIGDLSFTAVWRHLESHSISYDVNGGEGSIGTVLKLEGESAEIATASEVSRRGYGFVCWNTESDGTGKDYNPGDLYEEDADLQLYAKWSIVKYSIEYALNDGELSAGKSNPVEYTVETSDIVLENPTKQGYEFVGWRYKDDSDASASSNFSIKRGTTGNLSIVAVWKALETYTISYDANGGTGTIETQSEYKGTSLTISSSEGVERVGYTFFCWNTEKDGTGKDYKPNDTYSADTDLRLYAKWNPVKYSIKYDLDGGTFSDGSSITEYTIETDTFTLPKPIKPGYTFVGWNTKESSETHETISIEKGSIGDFEFFAVWSLEKYYITYDYADGKLPEGFDNPSDYTIETETFSLVNPKKDGYIFLGWIESCSMSEIAKETVSIEKGSTGNRSFIAVWRLPKKYTCIFDSNGADGGSVPFQLLVYEGDLFEVPPCGSLYRDDYVFEEWNTKSDGNGSRYSISEEIEIHENITLYAIWKESPLEYTYLSESDSYSVKCKDKSVSSIVIPSRYKGKSIIKVGDSAFYGCNDLESITIPTSVTSIGAYAFSGCSSLTSMTIPEGVESIGAHAFHGCSDLELIEVEEGNSVYYSDGNCLIERSSKTLVRGCRNSAIPYDVTSIGSSAFSGCYGLESITIPTSVASIGSSAFSGCRSLTSITIPEGVESIEAYAFSGCSSLTSVTIPTSVASIGAYAFSGCSSLTSMTIPEGVESIGDSAFYGCRSLTSMTIPEGVESIGDSAFYGCRSLTSMTIPEGVERIGNSVFYGCSSLTSITIPESVTSIDSSAFYGCSGIKFVVLNDYVCRNLRMRDLFPESYESIESAVISERSTSIGSHSFWGCIGLTSITIHEGLTRIDNSAFCDCERLMNVTIPTSVASIETYAFSGCSSLTSMTIPEGVESIRESTFSGCSSLTSVTIPTSVASIEAYAFSGCSSLTSVTIPTSVASIEAYAFSGCSSLTSVTIPEGVESIEAYAFSGCSSLTSMTIPEGVESIRESTFSGCSSLTSVTIPTSVASIEAYAFSGCSSLTSVTIPEGVESIEAYAFSGCSSLTSMTIPEGVESIRESTFSGCSSLTSVTIPTSVTSIGSSAFSGCRSLTSIMIPTSVTSIGNGAFKGSGLRSVTIPTSVASIGAYAFSGCIRLTNITIPDSVTSIEDYVFFGCSNLRSITIPTSVTSIGNGAFKGSGLLSVTIPERVASIGWYAFEECSYLGSITIPESVTSIGGYAFDGCSYLRSITIPTSVTSIGPSAFSGCIRLTNITIPDSVTSIEYSAFKNCSGLTSITIPESVTSIGDGAFKGSGLRSVTIPERVVSIDWNAFEYCRGLEIITIPESVTNIRGYAFQYCSGLTDIIYLGTMAQWSSIPKGASWNYGTGNYIIHCTDGDIAKN